MGQKPKPSLRLAAAYFLAAVCFGFGIIAWFEAMACLGWLGAR